ncbi:hypothetical protein PR048_030329, partial [Dryococelus australis]
MSPTTFENLLIKIKKTHLRESFSIQVIEYWRPTIMLAVTVRFLATEDPYSSLHYIFRISKKAFTKIVPEVCATLVESLKGTNNFKTSI